MNHSYHLYVFVFPQVQLSIQDVGVGWQRAFNRFARFEDADEDLQAAAFAAAEQCMEDPSGRTRRLECFAWLPPM